MRFIFGHQLQLFHAIVTTITNISTSRFNKYQLIASKIRVVIKILIPIENQTGSSMSKLLLDRTFCCKGVKIEDEKYFLRHQIRLATI